MKPIDQPKRPVILVTGGTGAEGGSVVRALLKEKKFTVRILTRNPESPRAKIFQRAGAELVQADMQKPSSLRKAMEGIDGLFITTQCGEEYDKEFQMGVNLIDAALDAEVEQVVMKTMPGYQKLSNGKFPVPAIDVKAELENYARKKKLPATFIHPAFYYENFLQGFPLQKDNNGGYYFGFPQGDTRLAMASIEDLGKMAAAVFNDPCSFTGKTLGLVGSDMTCDAYAAILSERLQRNVYYTYIPRNTYAAYDFPGAVEWANMFEVQRLHITGRQKDLLQTLRLNPATLGFEAWVEKNRDRFISYFNSQFQVIVI